MKFTIIFASISILITINYELCYAVDTCYVCNGPDCVSNEQIKNCSVVDNPGYNSQYNCVTMVQVYDAAIGPETSKDCVFVTREYKSLCDVINSLCDECKCELCSSDLCNL